MLLLCVCPFVSFSVVLSPLIASVAIAVSVLAGLLVLLALFPLLLFATAPLLLSSCSPAQPRHRRRRHRRLPHPLRHRRPAAVLFFDLPKMDNADKLYDQLETTGGGAAARAPLRAVGRRCLPLSQMRLILVELLALAG